MITYTPRGPVTAFEYGGEYYIRTSEQTAAVLSAPVFEALFWETNPTPAPVPEALPARPATNGTADAPNIVPAPKRRAEAKSEPKHSGPVPNIRLLIEEFLPDTVISMHARAVAKYGNPPKKQRWSQELTLMRHAKLVWNDAGVWRKGQKPEEPTPEPEDLPSKVLACLPGNLAAVQQRLDFKWDLVLEPGELYEVLNELRRRGRIERTPMNQGDEWRVCE